MKKIFLILLVSSIGFAACPSDKQPVFCQIIANNPGINPLYAYSLSRFVYDISKKHGIDHHIFTAILMQESAYRLSAKNCRTGYKVGTREIASVCFDFGISQINFNTIQAFKFDKDLLISNLGYSIEAGAIVLKDFKKRYGHREEKWWSRYNSSNPEKRRIYEQLVARWL